MGTSEAVMVICGEQSASCSSTSSNDSSYGIEHLSTSTEPCDHNKEDTISKNNRDCEAKAVDTRPRCERNTHARAIRRGLTEITPTTSHSQDQSPLFATLPSEVRNLIFEYAVCQTPNCSSPVADTSHTNRPGHKYNTQINTALLRTCRLIYYETRAIPLRSTTHHMYEAPSESFNPLDWDHYLFHLSSQSGHNLHHLHITKWRSPFTFSDHLNEHLHWRKMTWTLCASEWTPRQLMRDRFDVSQSLLSARFPDTCQEVNLEYESLLKFPPQRKLLREVAEQCRQIRLTRRNGTRLDIDMEYSMEYTWEGTTWIPANRGENHWNGDYDTATYHVVRICWRDKVPERNYMHYDHLDCLRSKAIAPMSLEDVEKDEENM
ncbi:hypothetical protein P280DRAFT_26612 [Massarina eburnea CBS 473.64]|uniref:F-box domain-containing protein n=1 Tax=Massarina eburnea CBS 473.64 TaxID=1395130 RepID=A0A6A6RWV8_9PLEO|nr:hypothetical protein P280DRAFT_26612 [Massarina eburnea CBS 473.64]